MPEGILVAEHLLGVGIGALAVVGKGAVQFVVGGDDIFDLRGELRFLKADGLNEQGLIRDQLARALQFGQGLVGVDRLFEHGLGFQVHRWRQQGQVVVGTVRIKGHGRFLHKRAGMSGTSR